jgi:hypothetical protein
MGDQPHDQDQPSIRPSDDNTERAKRVKMLSDDECVVLIRLRRRLIRILQDDDDIAYRRRQSLLAVLHDIDARFEGMCDTDN